MYQSSLDKIRDALPKESPRSRAESRFFSATQKICRWGLMRRVAEAILI
jgi:hypothetical protein